MFDPIRDFLVSDPNCEYDEDGIHDPITLNEFGMRSKYICSACGYRVSYEVLTGIWFARREYRIQEEPY